MHNSASENEYTIYRSHRATLRDSHGESLVEIRGRLTPLYGRVWLQIGLCYLGVIGVVSALAFTPSPASFVGQLALAGVGALVLGFAWTCLHLWIHEALHYGIHPSKTWNDRLGNLCIGLWIGQSVAAMRAVHFEHHRTLGTPEDPENSYFNPLDPRYIASGLLGLGGLRFLSKKREEETARNKPLQWTAITLHLGITTAALIGGNTVLGLAWLPAIGIVLPFFGGLRVLLEHRSPNAGARTDYYRSIRAPYTRVFGEGWFASSFGGAGFNRHLIHHWEPQLSCTRFAEMENFLLDTELADFYRSRQTSYALTLRSLLSLRRVKASLPRELRVDSPCLSCGAQRAELWTKARDIEYLATDEVFDYLHCLECDSLFIDPVPVDRLAEIYPDTYLSFRRGKSNWVLRIKLWLDRRNFSKLLRRVPGQHLNILDVGGGAGTQLDLIRESDPRSKTTTVVDISQDAVDEAGNYGHAGYCGRIEDFETDQKFDCVLMLNIIEHVANPGAVLKKLADLTHPGARIWVKTPNWKSLDERVFRNRSWAGYHCPRHWCLFTRESFTRLAETSGFHVVESAYTQGAPFWAASLLGNWARRGWINSDPARPPVHHPIFMPLLALFAAVDFARGLFFPTSQMYAVLERKDS